jgi:hypothetical protein
MTPEERQVERERRRAYCDGFAEAIQALMDLIPPGVLAGLGEKGRAVYAAYNKCAMHSAGPLRLWRDGDCSDAASPPEVEGTHA